MTDIYDLHRKAFSNVSAHAVLKNGDLVAKIAFKYPRDGAGRLYAYVHWLGVPMVRGFADGYGYDKHSAAIASAARRIPFPARDCEGLAVGIENQTAFISAVNRDSGEYWYNRLAKAGFTVFQII